MVKLEFDDLFFEDLENKIRVFFLESYFFDVDKKDLLDIGKFKVNKNSIEFDIDKKQAQKKFNLILSKGFNELKNKFNNKKTIYVHKNMNITLIGLNYFGIVDRNTSLIEVKPLTGCNFNCIYCSIDEGITSKKQVDFVVEKDFLVEEIKKLIDLKKCDSIEIYINPHGEPLLYKPLQDLIRDLSEIEEIKKIAMNTNGLLLDKNEVDELIRAGLKKFNISINSIDEKTAKKMAGCNYDPKKIIEICKYIVSKETELVIAPVWLQGFNDIEMPKIIEFAKTLNAKLGIQNFLNYKFGRNPCKALAFDDFFRKMKELEKKHELKLLLDADDFDIKPTEKLKKPFDRGDIVQAEILFDGRLKGEKIAFAKNRLISIPNCYKTGKVKIKIVRSKHNVFVGILA